MFLLHFNIKNILYLLSYILTTGDFMKLFIIKKKTLLIVNLIVILLSVSLLYFTIQSVPISAVNLTCDAIISDDFKNKVQTLAKGNEKIAYLTFDDGPNPSITPKVLDILQKEDIKATFFVIGKNVDSYPDIVKRAYEEGHYIANHGYDHNNTHLYKNNESFINEVKNTDIAIGKAIGVENYCAHVFRFPNGFMSPSNKSKKKEAAVLLSQMNYTYIDWNCLNNDSVKKYSSSQLLNNLKKSSKNKNTLVILMHDTKDVSNSSLVLEDSIKYLKSEGYTFQNFYDLIG